MTAAAQLVATKNRTWRTLKVPERFSLIPCHRITRHSTLSIGRSTNRYAAFEENDDLGEPIDLEIDGNMTSINVESEKVSPLPDGQPAPIPVHNSPIYQEAFLKYPDYLVVKTARASPDASTFTATFKNGHFETGLTREQIGALPHGDLQVK